MMEVDLFGAPVRPAMPKRKASKQGPDGPTLRTTPAPPPSAPPAEAPKYVGDLKSPPFDGELKPPGHSDWTPISASATAAAIAGAAFDWATASPERREEEVYCWFLGQTDHGGTAEQASKAFGVDVGVLVAQMAAKGVLEDTGRVWPREDRRTFARLLRAARMPS